MSYGIERGEQPRDAVLRIFREEITVALHEAAANKDREKGFHNARKSLKKTRGLLQIVRPVLPRSFFQEQNRRFRDAGRLLSPMRDVHSLRQTLKKLDRPTNSICLVLEQHLSTREQHELAQQGKVNAELKKTLNDLLHELDQWPFSELSAETLNAGLSGAYKRAKKAWKRAAKDSKPETLHEGRKKIKNLLYGLQLMEGFLPKESLKMLKRADKIADCLGVDHDFFVLQDTCFEQQLTWPKRDFHEFSKRVCKFQQRHQKRAFKLAEKVFKGKPLFSKAHALWPNLPR